MANEPEAEPLPEFEEEEGGPVKSFLEHLEDLRWMLIKSGVFAAVAMLICLLGGNHVVRILERPLMNAPMKVASNLKVMRVLWGTNQLGVFEIGTNESAVAIFGTNQFVNLQIAPIADGNHQVLGLNVHDDPQHKEGPHLPIDLV